MTKISYIAGIPQNEYADRGREVKNISFIPYLSLTKGEMLLALAAQRARVLAEWYGSDAPQYGQAAQMFENALNAGVSQGIKFINGVPDNLQQAAALIARAAKQTAPASKAAFIRPGGIMNGIGSTIIPLEERRKQCIDAEGLKVRIWEKRGQERRTLEDLINKKCQTQFNIEKILNDSLESSGHHMVYKNMPTGYLLPTEVVVKRTFHQTGIEGLAAVGKMDKALMYGWVENGIIGQNAKSAKVGPMTSVETSAFLAPDPLAEVKRLVEIQKQRPGVGIGIVPAAAAAAPALAVSEIVGLIITAVTAAATLIKALRSETAYAMSEARGFGTDAFSASKNDWLISGDNPPTTAGSDNTPLLIGAGLVGAYLLLK